MERCFSDIGILTIGRNAGEGGDRVEKDDFLLSDTEQQMLKEQSELDVKINEGTAKLRAAQTVMKERANTLNELLRLCRSKTVDEQTNGKKPLEIVGL